VLVSGQPAVATGLVTVEGTVKTITMENKVSGYIVTKIKVGILSTAATCFSYCPLPDCSRIGKMPLRKLAYKYIPVWSSIRNHNCKIGYSLDVKLFAETKGACRQ